MFKYFYFLLTRFLLNLNFLIHHKHINKNQITNLDLVIRLLKKRDTTLKILLMWVVIKEFGLKNC